MSSVRLAPPMASTSRPDENDLPLPRHTMARTSARPSSSRKMSNISRSDESVNALCFSGRLFVTIATAPSKSSKISPAIGGTPCRARRGTVTNHDGARPRGVGKTATVSDDLAVTPTTGLLSAEYRLVTIAILLIVSLAAFDALSVYAALPAIGGDLGRVAL